MLVNTEGGTVKKIILTVLIVFLFGCATSKLSKSKVRLGSSHPVKVIALAPDGGLMADAIGIELYNHGIRVVDSNETTEIMIQSDISNLKYLERKNLRILKDSGIDGYLTVKVVFMSDGKPSSVSARLSSTHTGELLAGVSWQAGWGGMYGSIAHNIMSQNVNDAAEEIAKELVERLSN